MARRDGLPSATHPHHRVTARILDTAAGVRRGARPANRRAVPVDDPANTPVPPGRPPSDVPAAEAIRRAVFGRPFAPAAPVVYGTSTDGAVATASGPAAAPIACRNTSSRPERTAAHPAEGRTGVAAR
ncbi:hypothetical protein ACFVXE_30380 [Streptomyces sp. NPDC058231]|uniref:hypothetical protein n=1 Tax=Streptomyces sp. NPDC058231 TaxID=3346392 RepID=UPI0036E8558D